MQQFHLLPLAAIFLLHTSHITSFLNTPNSKAELKGINSLSSYYHLNCGDEASFWVLHAFCLSKVMWRPAQIPHYLRQFTFGSRGQKSPAVNKWKLRWTSYFYTLIIAEKFQKHFALQKPFYCGIYVIPVSTSPGWGPGDSLDFISALYNEVGSVEK